MRSFLFFLFLIPLVLCSCPPNVTQALVQSDCTSFTFEVTITNPSSGLLTQLLLAPSSNLTMVDGMNVTAEGITFEANFSGIPSEKSYHFNYTHSDAEPVTFEVQTAECTKNVSLTCDPTVRPTEKPTVEPTVEPTAEPTVEPTTEPTSTPSSSPAASGKRPSHSNKPTSKPTTKPTSAPTSQPGTKPTTTPTSAPTTTPTTKPTTKPTTAPSNTTVSGTCSGSPRMLNGKPCASTTRYWDNTEGACGCGTTSGALGWVGASYTAAASPPIFGSATWCGTGCGKCYQLTATGYSPQGKGAPAGSTITIMVTNLCPPGDPNSAWCSSSLNSFEYGAHFDLADSPTASLISNLGWDNPEVVYEEVSCSGAALTASNSDYDQCICSAQ